eukprot:GHVS01002003.1.p1 GENE.GHVS01002003.1~~GHVS01002003.1.p1  ORF type:complete len:320 (-),score=15.63 GHVS01002003.1:181-1140(-)
MLLFLFEADRMDRLRRVFNGLIWLWLLLWTVVCTGVMDVLHDCRTGAKLLSSIRWKLFLPCFKLPVSSFHLSAFLSPASVNREHRPFPLRLLALILRGLFMTGASLERLPLLLLSNWDTVVVKPSPRGTGVWRVAMALLFTTALIMPSEVLSHVLNIQSAEGSSGSSGSMTVENKGPPSVEVGVSPPRKLMKRKEVCLLLSLMSGDGKLVLTNLSKTTLKLLQLYKEMPKRLKMPSSHFARSQSSRTRQKRPSIPRLSLDGPSTATESPPSFTEARQTRPSTELERGQRVRFRTIQFRFPFPCHLCQMRCSLTRMDHRE